MVFTEEERAHLRTLAEADDPGEFNKQLAKELKKLKKDWKATKVSQGYKGTGKKKHRRQIWVDFDGKTMDLWLETDRVNLGGVNAILGRPPPSVPYEDKNPKQVYREVLHILKRSK